MMQTEVAIFCRNEAKGLQATVRHICEHLEKLPAPSQPVALHLLENGSSDNTAEIVQQLADNYEGKCTLHAHTKLPAGKSKTWDIFFPLAQAPILLLWMQISGLAQTP